MERGADMTSHSVRQPVVETERSRDRRDLQVPAEEGCEQGRPKRQAALAPAPRARHAGRRVAELACHFPTWTEGLGIAADLIPGLGKLSISQNGGKAQARFGTRDAPLAPMLREPDALRRKLARLSSASARTGARTGAATAHACRALADCRAAWIWIRPAGIGCRLVGWTAWTAWIVTTAAAAGWRFPKMAVAGPRPTGASPLIVRPSRRHGYRTRRRQLQMHPCPVPRAASRVLEPPATLTFALASTALAPPRRQCSMQCTEHGQCTVLGPHGAQGEPRRPRRCGAVRRC